MHGHLVHPEKVQEPQTDLDCRTGDASWLPRCFIKGSPFASAAFESFVSHKEGAPRNSYGIEKEEGDVMGRLKDGSQGRARQNDSTFDFSNTFSELYLQHIMGKGLFMLQTVGQLQKA